MNQRIDRRPNCAGRLEGLIAEIPDDAEDPVQRAIYKKERDA